MKILKIVILFLLFVVLTILTQVGGIILLISWWISRRFVMLKEKRSARLAIRTAIFIFIYLLCTLLIVPLLAKPFGRTALPVFNPGLKPLNLFTCLLNRHYVRNELKKTALAISEEMNRSYPGTTIQYLDACFPFFNEYPLLPHLSHDDGKKLDLAFLYTDAKTKKPVDGAPSFIGYGVFEEPKNGETNTAAHCEANGYLRYGMIGRFVPQHRKNDYVFDAVRTKRLVRMIVSRPAIEKVFLEPHLVSRLSLTSSKIRFHGCGAVRHDDHIHLQIF